ncbi:hypothetical protein HDU80_009524 [Chytriomyces hyalinus]|nr:hypothetical protein HDU80_009524 [Chytriomyces hyalinus]
MFVNVQSGSKVSDSVAAVLDHLRGNGSTAQPLENTPITVTIRAKDKAMNKAISVVEIAKREFGASKLTQKTAISYYTPKLKEGTVTDTDPLKKTRKKEEAEGTPGKKATVAKVPSISITLTLTQ